jgi:hypothetical protein
MEIAAESSGLWAYDTGFFIRHGNTWKEYRHKDDSGVWATYTLYNSDENFYYVKNSNCKLAMPKSKSSNIYIMKNNESAWHKIYDTSNIYNYCPIYSTQVFTFSKGYFIKDGVTWKLFLNEQPDSFWATYTQYDKDESFYYIKNSSDKIAVPRKKANKIFWSKNNEWTTLYIPQITYDPASSLAGAYASASSSSSSKSSSGSASRVSSSGSNNSNKAYSGDRITKQYRENNVWGGYTDYIWHENGTLETITVTQCLWCHGNKVCGICFGMGGQMVLGNWYPCKSCLGTRVCQNCKGQGTYTVHNFVDKSGTGVSYDQNGNMASTGGGGGGSSSSSSKKSSSSSSTCSRCGGTGVNPTPNSGGSMSSWVAYYNTEGTKCPYCGRGTSHYHDRCSRCNVPK